jgi:hypothetical protein
VPEQDAAPKVPAKPPAASSTPAPSSSSRGAHHYDIGSDVEVLSVTDGKWMRGQVARVEGNGTLVVKYRHANGQKAIKRYSSSANEYLRHFGQAQEMTEDVKARVQMTLEVRQSFLHSQQEEIKEVKPDEDKEMEDVKATLLGPVDWEEGEEMDGAKARARDAQEQAVFDDDPHEEAVRARAREALEQAVMEDLGEDEDGTVRTFESPSVPELSYTSTEAMEAELSGPELNLSVALDTDAGEEGGEAEPGAPAGAEQEPYVLVGALVSKPVGNT